MILKWCLLWTVCFKGYKYERKREKGWGKFGSGDIQGRYIQCREIDTKLCGLSTRSSFCLFSELCRTCCTVWRGCRFGNARVVDIVWHYVTLCDIGWHYVTLCGIMWYCVALCVIVWVHQRLQCQLTRVLLCSWYRAVNTIRLGYKNQSVNVV